VVQDAAIIGVVGPAFSGELQAAAPILDQGGVTVISASATAPSLSTHGWATFHRIVGNDAVQGPAAGRLLKDVLRAQKVFVIDDASPYGSALADQVEKVL